MSFIVATEMPSGARSRGYVIRLRKDEADTEENKAMKWFAKVFYQMQAFAIHGSAAVLLNGDVEIERENIP